MFSAIIPLYNKADTVERAIRSVLNQTYPDFEIIVVDDGSTDRGADVVQAIADPRIRLIRQENGGVSAARNTGIEAARYDYLTFLDADDEYLPEFLSVIFDLTERYPEAGILGCGYYYVYPSGRIAAPVIKGISPGFSGLIPNYFEIAAQSAPPLWTGTVCIPKKAIKDIGGFPVGVAAGEDLLTWARLCINHSLAYCNRPLAFYHIGITNDFLPSRVPQKENLVGKELIALFKRHKTKGLKKYIAFWYKNRISCFVRLNMRWKAFYESVFAITYDPFNYKFYFYIVLCILPNSWGRYIIKSYALKGSR